MVLMRPRSYGARHRQPDNVGLRSAIDQRSRGSFGKAHHKADPADHLRVHQGCGSIACAKIRAFYGGQKLAQRPAGVVFELMDEVLDWVIENAEAEDALVVGDAGAFAVGAGSALGRAGHGA